MNGLSRSLIVLVLLVQVALTLQMAPPSSMPPRASIANSDSLVELEPGLSVPLLRKARGTQSQQMGPSMRFRAMNEVASQAAPDMSFVDNFQDPRDQIATAPEPPLPAFMQTGEEQAVPQHEQPTPIAESAPTPITEPTLVSDSAPAPVAAAAPQFVETQADATQTQQAQLDARQRALDEREAEINRRAAELNEQKHEEVDPLEYDRLHEERQKIEADIRKLSMLQERQYNLMHSSSRSHHRSSSHYDEPRFEERRGTLHDDLPLPPPRHHHEASSQLDYDRSPSAYSRDIGFARDAADERLPTRSHLGSAPPRHRDAQPLAEHNDGRNWHGELGPPAHVAFNKPKSQLAAAGGSGVWSPPKGAEAYMNYDPNNPNAPTARDMSYSARQRAASPPEPVLPELPPAPVVAPF